jgi:serine/threonine-protein kinase RsbW
MLTLIFPGEYESLPIISEHIERITQKAGFNDRDTYAVQLAVEEACSNIIEHAYGGESRGEIQIICKSNSDKLTIILRDKGQPFNPNNIQEPDLSKPLEELRSGGAGLFLINKLMDEVRFESTSGYGNVLTMVKYKHRSKIITA